MPIFEQLLLEEALLRTSTDNFCIINEGSTPAIVMGISGVAEKLLNIKTVKESNLPLIKRFSGGGTVIVDENTLFISFIMSKDALSISPFPEPILRWSEKIYQDAWGIAGFHLRENDYCIGDKKCGGNAQYITKDRWVHHTSFLWDFSEKNMQHLTLPEKRPKYRLDRAHSAFLTRLKNHSLSKEFLIQKLKEFANVKPLYMKDLAPFKAHRQATKLVEI